MASEHATTHQWGVTVQMTIMYCVGLETFVPAALWIAPILGTYKDARDIYALEELTIQ